MGLKTEDIGWDLSFVMVCRNHGGRCFRYYKRVRDRLNKYYPDFIRTKPKKVKPVANKISEIEEYNKKVRADNAKIEVEEKEYQQFLSTQTTEQFILAKKHGWRMAQILTEPQHNFHIDQPNT